MWHFVFSALESADNPDGETHMLQRKLFDQSLLSEDENDLLPMWECYLEAITDVVIECFCLPGHFVQGQGPRTFFSHLQS